MDGLLLVDKPSGWTSHDAVAFVRKLLGEKRAGHTGTLDPDATGLLLVLLGKATRLARYFEGDEKEYVAEMLLGVETDTQDASGAVVRRCPVPELSEAEVGAALAGFRGEITQTPPMYSAVKVSGRPLYKSARAGVEVARAGRKVTVRELDLLGVEGETIRLRAVCSKGTYVRTLCSDAGLALGSCACLRSLRRTAAGGYRVEDAVSVAGRPAREEVADRVLPMREMLGRVPAALLSEKAARGVKDGMGAPASEAAPLPKGLRQGDPVRLMDGSGELLAVGEADLTTGALVIRPKVVLV